MTGTIFGLIYGILAGLVLYLPACFAAGGMTNERRGNQAGTSVALTCAAVGLLLGMAFDFRAAREAAEKEQKRLEAEVAAKEARGREQRAEQQRRVYSAREPSVRRPRMQHFSFRLCWPKLRWTSTVQMRI